jgi:hypothetical protein
MASSIPSSSSLSTSSSLSLTIPPPGPPSHNKGFHMDLTGWARLTNMQCPLCGESFLDAGSRDLCLQSHHGFDQYKMPHFPCTQCPGRIFFRQQDLRLHLEEAHTSRPTYHCPFCPFTAITNLMVARHVSFHRNRDTHCCSKCAFQFRTNLACQTHCFTDHSTNIRCDVCTRGFKSFPLLAHHRREHDKIGLICMTCASPSETIQSLIVHYLVNHPLRLHEEPGKAVSLPLPHELVRGKFSNTPRKFVPGETRKPDRKRKNGMEKKVVWKSNLLPTILVPIDYSEVMTLSSNDQEIQSTGKQQPISNDCQMIALEAQMESVSEPVEDPLPLDLIDIQLEPGLGFSDNQLEWLNLGRDEWLNLPPPPNLQPLSSTSDVLHESKSKAYFQMGNNMKTTPSVQFSGQSRPLSPMSSFLSPLQNDELETPNPFMGPTTSYVSSSPPDTTTEWVNFEDNPPLDEDFMNESYPAWCMEDPLEDDQSSFPKNAEKFWRETQLMCAQEKLT